jgi:hypothetical protein
MGETRNVCRIFLVWKLLGKQPPGRPRREYNIKMNLREISYEGGR